MADTKISAMAAATEVLNADVVPIVNGGANFKATRQLLLTAGTGEDIELVPSAGGVAKIENAGAQGRVEVDASGNPNIISSLTVTVGRADLSTYLRLDSTDVWSWLLGGAILGLSIDNGGTLELSMDLTNDTAKFLAASGIDITYIPGDTNDWTGADPTTVYEALDRIAAAVGPIA